MRKMIAVLLLASSKFRLIFANPEMSSKANQENCIVLSASCGTSSENKWHKNPLLVTVPPLKTVIQAYDVEKFCIENNNNQLFQQSFCPADTSIPECYCFFLRSFLRGLRVYPNFGVFNGVLLLEELFTMRFTGLN